jgi:hypothetical protein
MAATRLLADLQIQADNPTAALTTVDIGLALQPHDEPLALTGLAAAHAAGRLTSFYDHLARRLDANRDPVVPAVTARYQDLRRRSPPAASR